jgi:hypothetical protein
MPSRFAGFLLSSGMGRNPLVGLDVTPDHFRPALCGCSAATFFFSNAIFPYLKGV